MEAKVLKRRLIIYPCSEFDFTKSAVFATIQHIGQMQFSAAFQVYNMESSLHPLILPIKHTMGDIRNDIK